MTPALKLTCEDTLTRLEAIFFKTSTTDVVNAELSYDDILLFSFLRGVSIVKVSRSGRVTLPSLVLCERDVLLKHAAVLLLECKCATWIAKLYGYHVT